MVKDNCCLPTRQTNAKVCAPPVAAAKKRNSHAASTDNGSLTVVGIAAAQGLIGTNQPVIELDQEAPLRSTRIEPFWIDATAVTNARFAAFVQATGYQTQAEMLGDSFVFIGLLADKVDLESSVAMAPWWQLVKGANWHQPAGPDVPIDALVDHPVVHVSWHDACAFAAWSGGRLPSEAEWEHAARGALGDVSYPWGNRCPNDDDFFPCNIWQGIFPTFNAVKDGFFATAPSESFQPNGYGLYNMVGNVWEWTADDFAFAAGKYGNDAQPKAAFKVCKGGSYLCHASYCQRYRIAARTPNSANSATGHTGFRLVYDQAPAQRGQTMTNTHKVCA